MTEFQRRKITNTGDAEAVPIEEINPVTSMDITKAFDKGVSGQTPCNAGLGGITGASATTNLVNVTVGVGKVRYVSAVHYSQDQLGSFKLSIAGSEVLRISVTIQTSHSDFSSSSVHRFEKPWKVAAGEAILFQYTNGNATATNSGGCVEMWEEAV